MNFDPSKFYKEQFKNITPSLSFDKNNNFFEWRKQVGEALNMLLGMPEAVTDAKPIIEYRDNSNELFDEIRFVFESEPDYFVPCHLIAPKNIVGKLPLVICLQGHTTGMHISLARAKYENDQDAINSGDRDFALSAVKQGYAALVMEQRGFGENTQHITESPWGSCHTPSMQALMLGRTMVGDRAFDVKRAIDSISHFDFLDLKKIGIMGNSGGGTTSFFAACVEPRIALAMPSCYFCTFEASIFSLFHCQCNFIPNILNYFEMPDLACLIAPRPLIIVSGLNDPIFPYPEVLKAFDKVKQIYAAANAADNCTLVTGAEGHRFYAEQGWKAFRAQFVKLG